MTAPTEAGAGVKRSPDMTTTEGQTTTEAKGAQWEILTTAEQVMAAHEAGRRVWNRSGKRCRWHEVGSRGIENIRAFLRMGWEYRAAIAKATGAKTP